MAKSLPVPPPTTMYLNGLWRALSTSEALAVASTMSCRRVVGTAVAVRKRRAVMASEDTRDRMVANGVVGMKWKEKVCFGTPSTVKYFGRKSLSASWRCFGLLTRQRAEADSEMGPNQATHPHTPVLSHGTMKSKSRITRRQRPRARNHAAITTWLGDGRTLDGAVLAPVPLTPRTDLQQGCTIVSTGTISINCCKRKE